MMEKNSDWKRTKDQRRNSVAHREGVRTFDRKKTAMAGTNIKYVNIEEKPVRREIRNGQAP